MISFEVSHLFKKMKNIPGYEFLRGMKTRAGHDLPKGINLFYFSSKRLQPTFSKHKRRIFLYHFDPKDELWATATVRGFWKEYPHLHPHVTLFEILYNTQLAEGNT